MVQQSSIEPESWTLDELVQLGTMLDKRPARLGGRTVLMETAGQMLHVRRKDGRIRPLKANAAQELFEQRRGQRNIVLKARQMGLTTWTAARFFLKTITQPGTMTVQVAHTQEAAEEIFRIVHRFLEWLPEELLEGPLRTSRLSTRQIVFAEIDSTYRVASAGDKNAGRGWTIQNLHCSELARWPGNPAEILGGLKASLSPTAEVILESTPEGVGGCFYDEWQKAGETGTVRHFFPWWLEKRYRAVAVDAATLNEDERRLMELHGLDLEQIGYRRELRANFRGLTAQEYAEDAESCFLASGEPVFEREPVEKRLLEAPEPATVRRNGEMRIWLPPMSGRRYLVAVDPAGGGSEGDFSAAQVLDLVTGMQCAEFQGHVGGLELAKLIVEMAKEYNGAVLVVERNNHGSGILALVETACGYTKLYKQNGQAGWLTTSLSRPEMIGRLDAALVENPERFLSRALMAECRSFVRLPNGGTGAQSGAHDDLVMAMGVGLAAREQLLAFSC